MNKDLQRSPAVKPVSTFRLLALVCAITACGEPVGTTQEKTLAKDSKVHVVEPDLGSVRAGSAADLDRQATEIIDAMVARAPEAARGTFRKHLEDRQLSAAFAGSLDPEIAKLGAILAGIRAVQLAPDYERFAARAAASDTRVRVMVALVPDLSSDSAVRATVVRRPDDRGVPLLLVRERDVTARDIAAGLRAAAMSVERHGVDVSRSRRMDIRGTSKPAHNSLINEQYVQLLRASLPRQIPDIGNVPATIILAPAR